MNLQRIAAAAGVAALGVLFMASSALAVTYKVYSATNFTAGPARQGVGTKTCRATIQVSESGDFSITRSFVKGRGLPVPGAFALDSPSGTGGAKGVTGSPRWEGNTNEHNGYRNHNGSWTIVLPFNVLGGGIGRIQQGADLPSKAELARPCRAWTNGNVKLRLQVP